MAAVSHVCKCVFIHIPKCGGTSIERYLCLYASARNHNAVGLGGIPRSFKTAIIANTHPEYFRFAFVRNPYDRFVSYYLHGMRLQRSGGLRFYRNLRECAEFTAEALEDTDFEKCESPPRGARPEEDFENWIRWHCLRQKDFLPDCNPETYLGVPRTDSKPLSLIGRLENFDEDFPRMRKLLRLPRIPVQRQNASQKRGHYSEYYDAAARRRVEEMYAEDLEILGYDYEQKGVVRSLPPLYDLKKAEQCRPEFSRRERRNLFLRALYFRTRTLRTTPLAPLWRLLPRRLRRRLAPRFLLKTG